MTHETHEAPSVIPATILTKSTPICQSALSAQHHPALRNNGTPFFARAGSHHNESRLKSAMPPAVSRLDTADLGEEPKRREISGGVG